MQDVKFNVTQIKPKLFEIEQSLQQTVDPNYKRTLWCYRLKSFSDLIDEYFCRMQAAQ